MSHFKYFAQKKKRAPENWRGAAICFCWSRPVWYGNIMLWLWRGMGAEQGQ